MIFHNPSDDSIFFLKSLPIFIKILDNDLYAIGRNHFGQLGIGNKIDQQLPCEVKFFKEKKIKQVYGYKEETLFFTGNFKHFIFRRFYF